MINRINSFRKNLLSEATSIPPVFLQPHLPSLDGIRGVAILVVIFGHIASYKLGKENRFIDAAFGVEIFFVLSGFLITAILLKEKVRFNEISLKRFYLRRTLRIFPLAYLYAVTAFIISKYIFNVDIHWSDLKSTFLYYVNFTHAPWFTGHYWSLSMEEQFYLFFPFILSKCSLRKYIVICLSFILMSPLRNFLAFHDIIGQQYFQRTLFLFQYNPILIGSFAAILAFKSFLTKEAVKWPVWIDCLLLLFAIFCYKQHLPLLLNSIICPVIISILIVKTMFYPKAAFGWFLNLPALKFIGVISYSLYIVQQPFTLVVWMKSSLWLDIIVNLVLLFITAFLLHRYFEKPFLKLKEKFRPPQQNNRAADNIAAKATPTL